MMYEIYYRDENVFTCVSISDVIEFINMHGYVIYNETEHSDYINIYCI